MTPTAIAAHAQKMAKAQRIECKILDPKKLGFGAMLAVSEGSKDVPKVVVLKYKHSPKSETIGLVGKGVTFDSGGISLKSPRKMWEMKTDMAGAAAVIEIMRGCKWGCKFCHAGWTTRPVREKDKDLIIKQAEEILKNTGHENLSLISLSSTDYRQIEGLAKELTAKLAKKRVSLSLPSLRTTPDSMKLTTETLKVRQSGVTVAPEAGTQRLRDIIGKKLSEEEILNGAKSAFSRGITAIKLYFMIGLPTETEEDLIGICKLARKILQIGREISKRARITVNLSTFIPKPHTPLQREQQITIGETLEKQNLIKETLRPDKKIEVRWHDARASFLEGVFSRGDKNLTPVLLKALELGAILDAWSEHFDFSRWEKAFAVCGIDPNEYLRGRKTDEALPWGYIKCGLY